VSTTDELTDRDAKAGKEAIDVCSDKIKTPYDEITASKWGLLGSFFVAVSDMDIFLGSKAPKICDISNPMMLILSWTLNFALEWVGGVLK
jgi:hypothetical protein